MIARENAVLFGSFGGWNSGDEAILHTVEALLGWADAPVSSESQRQVAVICLRVREGVVQEYASRGRRVIRASELFKVMQLLRHRQLIIGGGQLITGDRSYKGLIYLLILTTIARIFGKPAWMIGIGVEGVHRRLARWLCRRIVRNVRCLSCRDPFSLAMLRDAGCDANRLKLTADVVLSGAIASERFRKPLARRTIAVGLHHAPSRVYATIEEYISIVEALISHFPGYQIMLVSNDCRQGFDEEMLQTLRNRLSQDGILFQPFDSVENVITAYASASCVVSVRMHPLILALIHCVPVVGIARSNKVKQLADRLGFESFDPELDLPTTWLEKVRRAIDGPAPDIEQVRRLAIEQVQL